MTEAEIKKALELCANDGDCKECAINPHKGNYGYCTSLAIKTALDLINRKNAEIESLRENTKIIMPARSQGKTQFIAKKYNDVRAEAIKEFAERAKEKLSPSEDFNDFANELLKIVCNKIDQIAKEMGVEL